MSHLEELSALLDEDLLDFILKDGAPLPEIPGEENNLLDISGLLDPGLLDKDTEDMINSMLRHLKDEPSTLQDCLPIDSDSSPSEDQHLSQSSSSNFASSHNVQVDHSYSCHLDEPMPECTRSDTTEDSSSDHRARMGLENPSGTLGQSSSFPTATAGDAEHHQLVPGATMQFEFPELFLTEEERQFLENGLSLPPCLSLGEAEDQLLKDTSQNTQNKQPAQSSQHRKKSNMNGLENRMEAQNQELEKKVQLLQEQNKLLLGKLQKLQALVRQFAKRTTTVKTMVVILSLYLLFSRNISVLQGTEQQLDPRVLPQENHEFPNQVVAVVQEDAVMEELTAAPEDPSMSGVLSQLWEVLQSQSNIDPASVLNNISSCDLPAAAGSELGTPQPEEQCPETYMLQVPMEWAVKEQEGVEHAVPAVSGQQHADKVNATTSCFLG
ncbi:cyclic AMP-responsive element-binding protein 3 isoform X2 [Athene cunicularia]|uniref:cyclic AMP-responsive element-binding protein 3 isoform X2 n=1 Tax=Athene cunicularia TaxID=194338 RepID=UPI000EF6A580|nr:cyclic AMP-responsive element-binding protein 3 isoform X2 [Athene cunicularia]